MAELIQLNVKDFCCIEKMALKLTRRGLVLITGDNQDTDAADNNGSGKSTIPKALTWCLFGDTLDGDKYDEVIRWGAKRAEVEVLLRKGNEDWIVKRWRDKGKPGLSLEVVQSFKRGKKYKTIAANAWEGTGKELQQKIIDLLGQDFRAFCNVTLFGQGDVDRFFSSTDAVQKDTLHRILRSDVYRKAEKRLREREVKALKHKVSELSSNVDMNKARIEEYDLGYIKQLADEWEETRESRVTVAAAAARELVAEARAVDNEAKTERGQMGKEIAKTAKVVKAIGDVRTKIKTLEEETDEVRRKQHRANQHESELASRIGELDSKLRKLDADECPICTSPMKKGAPAKYRKSLDAERTRFITQRDAASEVCDKLSERVVSLQQQRNELAEKSNEHQQASGRLALLEQKLESFDLDTVSRKTRFKDRAKDELEKMREAQDEANPHADRLKEATERIKGLKTWLAKCTEEHDVARIDLAHHEFWVRGFGSQGLPSLLLDSTMPYITERANVYLQTLTDGDITLGFTTQRELKSKKGEKKDELTIDCTIEGVPNAKPSNGQRRKLEIAADLALMDLVGTRETESSLLMMDEVLDGLDAEGVSRVLRLLRDLRGKRSSIFVVTHEPTLAKAFERVVHVTKHNQKSTVSEVS